jgi:hypothetical protein
MRIVHIAESGTPAKQKAIKVNKKQDLKQSADLLANQLRNSRSATRNALRIFELELNEE